MFEIWGTFKKNDDRNARICRYFTKTFSNEAEVPLVPPAFERWENALLSMQDIVVTFRYFRYCHAPYIPLPFLEKTLLAFASVRQRTLIELSPMAEDFNLSEDICIPMTNNTACLKAAVKNSPIYFSEEMGCAYFTYMGKHAHMVWVENTESLALKHNLIKKHGFRGIYWRHPYALPEGNWESMYEIFQKRTRC